MSHRSNSVKLQQIRKYELKVEKCDKTLVRERKRTQPNVFYIAQIERDRKFALDMLKDYAAQA